MSTDHRAEAEKHLANAAYHLTEDPGDMRIAEVAAWIGQGHANLVRSEEQAATTADLKDAIRMLRRREYATREAVSVHIAKGLASREKARWSAARSLAQALDAADCNMDDLIDARLSDDGYDTKLPWTFPATAASAEDPWAAAPDITAEVPEPVRRVIAGHLAEALLGGQSEDVRQWARGITFELKRVGADLAPDIEARIRNLTLGYDPSAPPF